MGPQAQLPDASTWQVWVGSLQAPPQLPVSGLLPHGGGGTCPHPHVGLPEVEFES
jgi:hypothetical protein